MPRVLSELQSEQVMGDGRQLKLANPVELKAKLYAAWDSGLAGCLERMSEPTSEFRERCGVAIPTKLAVFFDFPFSHVRELRKDIH